MKMTVTTKAAALLLSAGGVAPVVGHLSSN
jgi:hypothetical protein